MRILAFVDLHASMTGLIELKKKVKEKKPDLLISAGDMTIFAENMEWVMGRIAKLKVPCLVIPGNHEEDSHLSSICKMHDNLIYLHKKTFEKEGILFIGHGGGGFSFEVPDFDKFIDRIKEKIKKYDKIILVTHQPPFKTNLDVVYGGRHVGSKTYRKFLQKYNNKVKMMVCGHIHECQRKHDKLGKTRMLNPGPTGVLVRTEFR